MTLPQSTGTVRFRSASIADSFSPGYSLSRLCGQLYSHVLGADERVDGIVVRCPHSSSFGDNSGASSRSAPTACKTSSMGTGPPVLRKTRARTKALLYTSGALSSPDARTVALLRPPFHRNLKRETRPNTFARASAICDTRSFAQRSRCTSPLVEIGLGRHCAGSCRTERCP